MITDLLEKSRITYQMPGLERNYHIFYFLLSNQVPELAGYTAHYLYLQLKLL
jgi:myosin heavy subunit